MPMLGQQYQPTEIEIRNLARFAACKLGDAAQALAETRGDWDRAVAQLAAQARQAARRRARARRGVRLEW